MQVQGKDALRSLPSSLMTDDERAAWKEGLREGLRLAAASGRRTNTADKLTATQRRLVQRAVNAHRKARRAAAAHRGLITARDELVRQALDLGVGPTLLARQLGVNRAVVWKSEQKSRHEREAMQAPAGAEPT